jgi:hypothetical protein
VTRSGTAQGATKPRSRWALAEGALVVVLVAAMLAMWIYAFFLAPREARNRVGDRAWAARAEQRCAVEVLRRASLADFRSIEEAGADALLRRADIVDEATDGLAGMVSDIAAYEVTDAKGAAIVPLWIADWQLHIEDRRAYSGALRAGRNESFGETRTDEGLPLSEKIATFAQENEMPSCRPPRDLSV